MSRMIQPGENAPDFDLPDQDGNPVRLSDLRGSKVVLYFHPKADTRDSTTSSATARRVGPAAAYSKDRLLRVC